MKNTNEIRLFSMFGGGNTEKTKEKRWYRLITFLKS